MEMVKVELTTPENPKKRTRVTISKDLPLKAFLDTAERLLNIEIFSMYVDMQKLSDMAQLSEGATVLALSNVSPNLSKFSFFDKIDCFDSRVSEAENNKGVNVVVLGPPGAGKTSLILRFVHGFFKSNDVATVMESEYEKTVQVRSKEIPLTLIDTSGDKNYDISLISRLSAIDAFVLSIGTDQFHEWPKVAAYYKLIKKKVQNPFVLLLVTKIDLYDKSAPGKKAEIKQKLNELSSYADGHHLLMFKTSAKTSKNIDKVFQFITTRLSSFNIRTAEQSAESQPKARYPFLFRFLDQLLAFQLSCTKK